MSLGRVAFLGVTTRASSVHLSFPGWSRCLDHELALEAIDLPLRSPAIDYRRFVERLRSRENSLVGALITSHKTSVFDAAGDLFHRITPAASVLQEVGMVYWRGSELVADANDALSTKAVSERLLLRNRGWQTGLKRAVVLGAGGAGSALVHTLATQEALGCTGIAVTEADYGRAKVFREQVNRWDALVPVTVYSDRAADSIVQDAGQGALIVNATGLGKDTPGCPVSPNIVFPLRATIWEFNYRFTNQEKENFWELAKGQQESQSLVLEDGWDYFVWGWLGVMSNIVGLSPYDHYSCFASVAEQYRGSAERRA
jgi:shikimate dehydrogenase